jgi:Type II secretion system (T2SS), protein M subtype b
VTSRDFRALRRGGAIIVATLLVLRGGPWAVRSLRHLRERAIAQAKTAAQAREVLMSASAVRDSLGSVLGAIVGLAPELVDGHSEAEAAASLSGVLNLQASQRHIRVVRLDPLPDSGVGVFGRVTVHAELEGDVGGLAGLLKTIEAGESLLSVSTLVVTAPDPIVRGNSPELLHVELDVSGYYLPRGNGP